MASRSNTPPPTGNVTFLFTDIEGSTALYENYPYQMQAALKRHNEILRSSIESYGGYVFNMVGDAFCAAFNTATEAVQAALAAQRALSSEAWPENVTLRVRMGLHTGIAEESEGDYFGPPVNRVARLMSTGHGGQVLLSDATYNLVRDALPHLEPEAELRYLGEHRLKDLKNTERIFQLNVPDLPKEFPPLKTHGLITPTEVVNLDRRYRRIRYLGGGGFGDVYLVRHEALDKDMALKVLKREYASDEQFVRWFKREARSAAKLSHPNVVQVYDAGEGIFEDDRVSYIAMEYVLGGTLRDLIRQHEDPLPPLLATDLMLQVAKALEVAHRGKVIHRDIKPENILLTESGEAKVADFGIATALSASTRAVSSSALGTPRYMSPEQAKGEKASFRSDLYSLGVVLYEMLTGKVPFDAETPVGVAMKHISEPLRPPKEANPQVPEGINAVCVRLLAKDPNQRYPSAAALIEDLERVRDNPDALVDDTGPTIPDLGQVVADTADETVVDDEKSTIPADLERTKDDPDALVRNGGPETVEVPDLGGQTLSQAHNTLAKASLSIGSQEENPSETVREGEIVAQDPPAGTGVEAYSLVSVTVSSGTSTVEVPELVGQELPQARSALAEVGLKLGGKTEAPSDKVSKGRIISQDPAKGTKAKRGSSVSVTASTGRSSVQHRKTVRVPNLTGKSTTIARSTLTKAGLTLGDRREVSSGISEGLIVEQSPEAGTEVEQGSLVSVTVSSGQQEEKVTVQPGTSPVPPPRVRPEGGGNGGEHRRRGLPWVSVAAGLVAAALALIGAVWVLVPSTQGGNETTPATKNLTLGNIGWEENVAVSNLTKALLEDELGYENVELQTLEVARLFEGVGSGELDAFQDVWLPNHQQLVDEQGGRVELLGSWYQGETRLGIAVPSYVPITSIPELSQTDIREILGIEPGAVISERIPEEVIPTYDLEQEYVESSTAGMLSEVDRRYKDREPFAFIAWSPHWMNQRYDFRFLEDPEDALGELNNPSTITTVVNEGLQENDPASYAFMAAMTLTENQLNDLENTINEVGDPLEGARQWIKENRDIVQPWIEAAQNA